MLCSGDVSSAHVGIASNVMPVFFVVFLKLLFIAYREQTVSVGKWTRVDAIYEGSLIKIEVSPI